MTEKQVRLNQLHDLEKGVYSGSYVVSVRHFDGRLISMKKFDDKTECLQVYKEQQKEYNHFAYVRKYCCFEF